MSVLSSSLDVLGMTGEVKNACIAAVTLFGFLAAIDIGWRLVRNFVVENASPPSTLSEYHSWCAENDTEPIFDIELEYLNDDEIDELWENSDWVDDGDEIDQFFNDLELSEGTSCPLCGEFYGDSSNHGDGVCN